MFDAGMVDAHRVLGRARDPDPAKIADADWFAPDELPRIPPKLSIARGLIDDFVRRHGGTPRD